MILIPELEKILILVPRTASTSLKRAVLDKYPESIMLYRHMEADNVPQGYGSWQKIGIVRHPLDRLWSLYNYLGNFNGNYNKEYISRMVNSVAGIGFEQWLTSNNVVFSSQYIDDYKAVEAKYTVLHRIPENFKSQQITLRPDLGTKIFKFEELHLLADELNITLEKSNESTPNGNAPLNSSVIYDHMNKFFAWDMQQYNPESTS